MPLPHVVITAENGATIPEDVLRNADLYFGTPRGEMETDRAYGITSEIVDKPPDEGMRIFALDALGFDRYETRCSVMNIIFDGANVDGNMRVEVVIAV